MTDLEARDVAGLLRSARFAKLSTYLERGGHIGPEDGENYDFLRRHLALVDDFYATWNSRLVEDDQCFHLAADAEHFGRKHIGRHEMLVGAITCTVRLDPNSFADGLGFEEFVQRVEIAVGSADLFLQLFAPSSRIKTDVDRRETARDRVWQCLRELSSLGFLDLTGDASGERRIRPRNAIHRFAMPAQMSGGDPDRIAEAVDALVRRGTLSRLSPGNQDD